MGQNKFEWCFWLFLLMSLLPLFFFNIASKFVYSNSIARACFIFLLCTLMTSANKSLEKKNFHRLRLEQLLRIFRALQTSRVLRISMNARWRMNQLLNFKFLTFCNIVLCINSKFCEKCNNTDLRASAKLYSLSSERARSWERTHICTFTKAHSATLGYLCLYRSFLLRLINLRIWIKVYHKIPV